MTKKNQAVKPAADQAADIFTPIAPAGDPTLAAAFDAAVDGTPGAKFDAPPAGGIDFEALGEKMRQRQAIETDAAQHSGHNHNQPINTTTGAPEETAAFFMDLSKADDFELIAAGTRAVAVCVAADAVLSGNGNPMLNLRVKIERVKGAPDMSKAPMYRNRSVKDRLMFIPPNETTGSRGTIWRVRLAFKAFDVAYDAQAFRTQADFMAWLQSKAEAFIGSVAEVVIGIDDGTSGGTKSPQIDTATGEPYPPKNTIAQYFPYVPNASGIAPAGGDLPF